MKVKTRTLIGNIFCWSVIVMAFIYLAFQIYMGITY